MIYPMSEEAAEIARDLDYRGHVPSDEDEARDRARDEGRFDDRYRPNYEGLMCEALDRINEAAIALAVMGAWK